MPDPKKFALEVDHANPHSNNCWDRGGNPKTPEPSLDIVNCEVIGAILRGKFDSATGAPVSLSDESTQAVTCIVVTVGGSVYKICT